MEQFGKRKRKEAKRRNRRNRGTLGFWSGWNRTSPPILTYLPTYQFCSFSFILSFFIVSPSFSLFCLPLRGKKKWKKTKLPNNLPRCPVSTTIPPRLSYLWTASVFLSFILSLSFFDVTDGINRPSKAKFISLCRKDSQFKRSSQWWTRRTHRLNTPSRHSSQQSFTTRTGRNQ